jgi:hypothetical protein
MIVISLFFRVDNRFGEVNPDDVWKKEIKVRPGGEGGDRVTRSHQAKRDGGNNSISLTI